MKKELTLEHLAPYLPYGLNLIYHQFGDPRTTKMTIRDIETVLMLVNRHVENKARFPILRPLSDLTKEIEHKGERFVPLIKLVDPDNDKGDWAKCKVEIYNPFPHINMNHKYFRVVHDELGEVISVNPKNINVLPYSMIQKLFEWHFAVNIPDELYIDINTLNIKS